MSISINWILGTTTNVAGLPDEQIGYLATEEYASRINSRPGSSFANPAFSNAASNKIDSSLKATDLADDEAGSETTNDLSRTTTTDSEIIHVEAPEHYWKTVTGERVATPPFELGTHGGNISELGGLADEKGYETPILASDEPRLELGWQKPAVLPITYDLQGSSDIRNNLGSYPGSAGHSRPGSRPGSITGVGGLSRVMVPDDLETYTPLDDVEEYEPLFDDEDKDHQPLIEAARLKRRPDTKHRFPSQDIWEDTPDSARLETEVDTPEPEKQELSSFSKTSVFEPPEAESARKGEISEIKSTKLLSNEERLAQSDFKPQIYLDARSNSQRFPSSDIWEDTPDSAHLETVVGEEEVEAENTAIKAGAVVHTTTDRGDLSGSTPREGTTSSGPFIPQRPIRPLKHKSSAPKEHSHLSEVYNASGDDSQSPIVEVQRSPTESRKAPNIPERPKPQVPARPNKLDLISPPEESPSLKSKPPVPARPAGSKIAALQAGFMSDLNNRLKLGPQALPKQTESEKSESVQVEEQAALADARKSRAKGPARRKPATSPVIEPPQARKMPKLSIAKPITVWHISPKGTLDVVYEIPEPPLEDLPKYQSEKKSDSPTDRPVEEIAVPTKSAEAPSIPASAPPQQSMGINSDEEHDSSADAKQSIGIDPLLISSGVENRVSLPDGKAIAVHAQSVDDKVTIADTEPPQTTSSEHIGTDKSTKATSPAQTGTKEIEINPNTPGSQKLTVIEGGNALTGEDVVIHAEMPKDDEGHIRQDLM